MAIATACSSSSDPGLGGSAGTGGAGVSVGGNGGVGAGPVAGGSTSISGTSSSGGEGGSPQAGATNIGGGGQAGDDDAGSAGSSGTTGGTGILGVGGFGGVGGGSACPYGTDPVTCQPICSGWGTYQPDGSCSCIRGTIGPKCNYPSPLQIATSRDLACLLMADHSVTCWGKNPFRAAPTGPFASIVGGEGYIAGIRADGSIGYFESPGADAEITGAVVSLGLGAHHACATRSDTSVDCVGTDVYGETEAPAGTFTSVSVGGNTSCGIRSDGSLACWGDNSSQQATPPAGSFSKVAVGATNACGQTTAGDVICWGSSTLDLHQTGATLLANGDGSLCLSGAYSAGELGPPTTVAYMTLGGSGVGLLAPSFCSTMGANGCALDGLLTCAFDRFSGGNAYGLGTSPIDTYTSIASGADVAYAMTPYGWNTVAGQMPNAIYGVVTLSFTNHDQLCAIRDGNIIACGKGDSPAHPDTTILSVTANAPASSFVNAGAGGYAVCGIGNDGSLQCWLDQSTPLTTLPTGSFTSVGVGDSHLCGLKTDGTIACSGNTAGHLFGQDEAPSGTYVALTAGYTHNCALTSAGDVTCWGDNGKGQSSAPTGKFSAISAGKSHTCGIHTDGTLECWGDTAFDQIDAPAGKFSSLSAGETHTCAIRTDMQLVCWGSLIHPAFD